MSRILLSGPFALPKGFKRALLCETGTAAETHRRLTLFYILMQQKRGSAKQYFRDYSLF
jgi:hypothetical protein